MPGTKSCEYLCRIVGDDEASVDDTEDSNSVDHDESTIEYPVIENRVVAYNDHGATTEVMYLKDVRGKFKNKNPSRVVVKVEACTVSRMDCEIRRNAFHHQIKVPYVPGCDLVGTVIAMGTDAMSNCDYQVGDRVCALGLKLGGNARYAIVDGSQLMKAPKTLDAAEVACLIRTYVTAFQCLHRVGRIQWGDRILVVGGSGCVGQAVVQLARIAGAEEIYATSGKAEHSKKILESLGAEPVDRKPREWLPIVEGDMDIVIDLVGNDYESSIAALNAEGKLVILGEQPEEGYLSRFFSQKQQESSTFDEEEIFDLFEFNKRHPDKLERDLERLFGMLKYGEIAPKISKCIPLDEVANAHKEIDEGGVGGAIVCMPYSSEVTFPEEKLPKGRIERFEQKRVEEEQKIEEERIEQGLEVEMIGPQVDKLESRQGQSTPREDSVLNYTKKNSKVGVVRRTLQAAKAGGEIKPKKTKKTRGGSKQGKANARHMQASVEKKINEQEQRANIAATLEAETNKLMEQMRKAEEAARRAETQAIKAQIAATKAEFAAR